MQKKDKKVQSDPKVLVTYRLPPVLHLALQLHNTQTGRSRNITVEDALTQFKPLRQYIKVAEKEVYGHSGINAKRI